MVHLVALAVMKPQAFNMQTALEGIRSTNKLPAMGCAVIGMKTAPKIFVTGVRKAGVATKVLPTDTWHLGSCTKAMTGAVVASFVQQGAFQYTATLKSLCGLTNAIPYYRTKTLDNLVHMTANLDHDPAKGWFYYEGLAQTELVKRKKAAVDMTLALPVETMSPPYHYSNASFVFAGLACELYSKSTIETLLKQRIFTPLHLTSAAYGPNPVGMPWPHVNGVPVAANGVLDNPPVMTAAGRVRVSLHDWAYWAREVMKSIRNNPTVDGTCILPSLYGQRLA